MGHMPKACLQSYLHSVVFFHFRFGWEHGSSNMRYIAYFWFLNSPYFKRITMQNVQNHAKSSKNYEKIATSRASYSLKKTVCLCLFFPGMCFFHVCVFLPPSFLPLLFSFCLLSTAVLDEVHKFRRSMLPPSDCRRGLSTQLLGDVTRRLHQTPTSSAHPGFRMSKNDEKSSSSPSSGSVWFREMELGGSSGF